MIGKYRLNFILFVLTFLTTTQVGALNAAWWRNDRPEELADFFTFFSGGLPFSFALLAILLAHEMGHFLTAIKYGVEASAPFFIPLPYIPYVLPSPFGTLGALIKMKANYARKKAIFDIGIAGPLAGFTIALPVLFIGLSMSRVGSTIGFQGITEGNSILYWLFKATIFGKIPDAEDVMIHPIAWAGWIGCFVTALNLLPVGQLDGGHITYAFLGRAKHRIVGTLVFLLALAWGTVLILDGILEGITWIFFSAIFFFVIGVKHPPVMDEEDDLDPVRRFLVLVAFFVFVLTFTPIPMRGA